MRPVIKRDLGIKSIIRSFYLLFGGYRFQGSNLPGKDCRFNTTGPGGLPILAISKARNKNTATINPASLPCPVYLKDKPKSQKSICLKEDYTSKNQDGTKLIKNKIKYSGLDVVPDFAKHLIPKIFTFQILRLTAIILLLGFTFETYGQCPTISNTSVYVSNYCRSDGQIELTATGPSGTSFTWNTGATGPVTLVPGAGIYSVTFSKSQCSNFTQEINVGGDVVVNGNFSASWDYRNPYFTTQFTPNNLCSTGRYVVTTNAHTSCDYMYGYDHTHFGATPSQPFLAMNSYDNAVDRIIWGQTVTVKPNTYYYFSLWAMDLGAMDNHPVNQLDLRINGVPTRFDLPIQQGNTARIWQHVFINVPWFSGSNTSVTISVTQPYRIAIGGNSGLDDISFSELNPVPLSVTTTTLPVSPFCEGTTFQVTSTITGGNAPITYAWTVPVGVTPPGNVSTFSSTVGGTYSVTVTDRLGCTASSSVNVTVNPKPAITAMTSAVCSATVFTVTPVDGTNGVVPTGTRYSWPTPTGTGFTGGASGTNASNISGTLTNTTNAAVTATYTVTPTSGTCTGSPFTITMTVNPKPAVTNMAPTPVCSGVGFAVTPVNGTNGIVPAGTTYSWPAPTGTGFTGGAAGSNASDISGTLINTTNSPVVATYTVTPKSGAGCAGNAFSVTVTVNPKPTVAITNPASACSPATVDLTASEVTEGSTTGLTFTYWTDASASMSLASPATVTTSGIYYIKGTTLTGCFDIMPVTVTVNPKPTVVITNPIAACSPFTVDLTAPAVTTGSTSGLTFTYWTDAGASIALANPNAVTTSGTYYIKGTTATGCSDIKPVSAVDNCICINQPSLTLNGNSGTTCVSTPITISNNSFGGSATSVTITENGAGSVNPSTINSSTFDFTYTPALGDGGNIVTITVTTDNPAAGSCVAAVATYSLTVNSQTIPTFADVGPYCSGASIPALPTTSLNGIIGTWSPAIDNTETTAYNFTPTPGQCATGTTLTITIEPNITPTFTQIGPLCQGSTPPALPLSSTNTPAITGTWSPAVITTATSGTYPFTFTPDAGQCATTSTMDITVNPLPVVPNVADPAPVCPNGSTSITVATGNSWQWEVSSDNGFTWSNITSAGTNPVYAGYTSQTLSVSGIVSSNNGYQYKCIVTDNNTCFSESNSATLTVKPDLVITASPADQAICEGGDATFTISATGTGIINYQWQTWNGSTWINIATGTILTVNNGIPGARYRSIVTDDCGSKTSNEATILPYKAKPPVTHPDNASSCEGPAGIAIFTAEPYANTSYQWQVNKNDGNGWIQLINDTWGQELGVRSSQLFVWTPDRTKNGYQYRAVLTSTTTTCSQEGNPATLTIDPLPDPPTNITVDNNDFCAYSVNFITLTATGGNGTGVKWYQGSCKGAPLGDTNPITIAAPTSTMTYYASSVNSCGESVTCASITVNVKPEPPRPTNFYANFFPPQYCSGSPPHLPHYNLITEGGPAGNVYEWRQGGNCGTGTLMSSTLTTGTFELIPPQNPVPTQTTTYYVRTTDGTCWSRCLSLTVTVYTLPTPPVSAAVSPNQICAGTVPSITLTSTGGDGGTGNNPVLKWYSGSCGGTLVGTGTPLTIAAPSTTTTYFARWESSCGASTCQSVTVAVNQLPTAVLSGGATICAGSSTNLSVALTGQQPWSITYTDGSTPTVISGITSSPYLISVSPTNPSTTYTLTAVNDANCSGTYSGTAQVLAYPLPTPYTVTGGGSYCEGGSGVAVGIANSQSSSSYQLYVNGNPTGSPVNGTTGQSKSFGLQTLPGTYTVIATGRTLPNCTNSMLNSVTVTVNPKPTISGKTNICPEEITQLVGSGTPAANAWTSSNTSVATVSSTGLVTGGAAGSSSITYTDINGCSESMTIWVGLSLQLPRSQQIRSVAMEVVLHSVHPIHTMVQ